MPIKKRKSTKSTTSQPDLLNIQERVSTAPCVPALRERVKTWRKGGYKGATKTTSELLNYWFYTDHHLPTGGQFRYHQAQQEAIETLIYVYEIVKARRRQSLLEKFAVNTKELRLPSSDEFARYCLKMATGSGKTKVMALAIIWQYFNAVREDDKQYAKTFLVLAPNVIVFERLKEDFASGKIFRTDPLFPRHFKLFWEMECYMRGEAQRTHSDGALYLTNIQQFYERANASKEEEPAEITALLGDKPQTQKLELTDFAERIAQHEGLLLVLNDEAHHTHDEDSEWNQVIRRLHSNRPIAAQLDFSATPRYTKGGLFAWTISDYPLKQAIVDNIVKRPIKGISKIEEAKSALASVKYEGFLVAAVERWKEYRQQLTPLRKKPIIFIMLNSTKEADDVADWLRKKYATEFGDNKTLVIHTDRKGEISKRDLDKARSVARQVDNPDCPVNAIVSVLMLREGWDVQNVTVVVGLRPYTAKANILPEQTIGRGLRLMFRGSRHNYRERVDIIGNQAFLKFVEDLEKLEGLKLDTFQLGKDKLKIYTVMPVAEKQAVDIAIPELSPTLGRKTSLAEEIAAINVMDFDTPVLPIKANEKEIKQFTYEGIDALDKKKLFERVYEIPPAQTPEEVIGYYARLIAQHIKLPSQFAALAPKIQEFFGFKAFGKKINLYDGAVIQAMSTNLASYIVTQAFEKVLRQQIIEEIQPTLYRYAKQLSTTPPFPFSRLLLESDKTVFNYVACDNEFERDFAQFLNRAEDIIAFAKLPEQFGFSIQYTDSRTNLRHYYPDFVVKRQDGQHWLIETKGREDIEVKLKDEAASYWCKNATHLCQVTWDYLKVPQNEFEKLQPSDFEELCIGLQRT
jgi:type III restriction enzyme